jgi:Ca2+-binding EF-hand superfamily protein
MPARPCRPSSHVSTCTPTCEIACASTPTDLAELFHIVDNGGAGYLDWVELRRCLRGLGFPVTKPETRQLVRERCESAGQVTLKLFYEIVEDLANTQRDAERDIRRGFHLMSSDGRSVTEVGAQLPPTRARAGATPSRCRVV